MLELLDYKLFELGGFSLKIYNLINLLVFLIFTVVLLNVVRKIIYRSRTLDISKKFSINKLTGYVIIALAFIFSLHLLGFDVSVLLAGSAALLVGLGFGLQNLFNDFISGIVLLLDGTLKVNDIIEVNSRIYRVEEIKFRTTTAIDREENYVIIPNSELTGNRVINWTHEKLASRFTVNVGVDYSSDVNKVMQLLIQAATEHPKVSKEPKPFVRFENYGDSSLDFSLYFISEEIFRVDDIKSQLRIRIYQLFSENKVTIPFPQRVLHFDRKSNDIQFITKTE